MDEECHLGVCTSNIPESGTDRGESRYKVQKRLADIVRGDRAPMCKIDSEAIIARRMDEECHLGVCTSRIPQSDTDSGESRYKVQKRLS